MAEGISGSVELIETHTSVQATDATGLSTESRASTFFQRYRFYLDNRLYPTIGLQAGVSLDKSTTDAGGEKTTAINMVPTVALTLRNPFVSAGVSYTVQEQKSLVGGNSTVNYRDDKSAYLGFRPEGLPTLNVLVTRSHLYDRERVQTDRLDDTVQVGSNYAVKDLNLSYQAVSAIDHNQLDSTEVQQLTQTGRATYGTQFFNNRAQFNSSFTVIKQDTTLTRPGASAVEFQLFPFAGLSGINDTPTVGTLTSNVAVIDGVLTASTGMNIGQLPSSLGDTKRRNVGLDFGSPVEVNNLFVWVDRAIPASVANTFVWEIYTSSDGQNWSLAQTVAPAAFGLFNNRFEISFSNVTARYIKAVTRPLGVAVIVPPGVDLSNIFITELQAFISRPATTAIGKSSVITENGNVGFRVNIQTTDTRSVFYDVYFQNFQRTGQPAARLTLTNALSANQQFSSAVAGTARITRENDQDVKGERTGITSYDTSLSAAASSLPKLNHSLTWTENMKQESGNSNVNSSVFLNNVAEIYPGIDASLGAGESLASATGGVNSENSTLAFGASFVPHRAVSLSLSYNATRLKQSGGGTSSSTTSETEGAGLTYSPFSSLYFTASVSRIVNDQVHDTIHSYGVSWAVQQTGGSLQFNFAYQEGLTDQSGTSTFRTMSPSVRWKINPKMFAEAVASDQKVMGPSETTHAKSIVTSFKMYL